MGNIHMCMLAYMLQNIREDSFFLSRCFLFLLKDSCEKSQMKNKQNTTKDRDRFSKYYLMRYEFGCRFWVYMCLYDMIDREFPKPHPFQNLSKFECVLKISPDENSTNKVCSNTKKIAKKSLGSLVTLFTNSLTSPSIYSQSSHTSCLITFFFRRGQREFNEAC